mmetsp:Transcript_11610/g.16798  ORF Transcript_11610/g.16798 Transcript_11610/m.16798 type:complete len:89 (-) Transcript_11610:265-531(-)
MEKFNVHKLAIVPHIIQWVWAENWTRHPCSLRLLVSSIISEKDVCMYSSLLRYQGKQTGKNDSSCLHLQASKQRSRGQLGTVNGGPYG